ncbi:MAG: methyltransferase domain-containing protein [Coxiellaceae bacterium]|nr:methyltransferase domain-containing protein [Coxiellaceae bacterium]
MSEPLDSDRLISHHNGDGCLQQAMDALAEKIKSNGDTSEATVEQRLDYLQQLSEFDFGRFLIINQGINGFWTHYMLTFPWRGKKSGKNNAGEPFSEMETFLLNSPILLATQQRFEIFLQQNQMAVKNGAVLASVPCGLLGELLYLNYKGITDITLAGLDYDPETLHDAKLLAEKQGIARFVETQQTDAWHLNIENRFDLLSSNGLNIYEPDDDKVTDLYRQFYKALKPGGKLVTSYVTPPPHLCDNCEWDLDKINISDGLKQKAVYLDTLQAKWQCFRSTATTKQQLTDAGFEQLTFLPDRAHMFPTVTAIKPT